MLTRCFHSSTLLDVWRESIKGKLLIQQSTIERHSAYLDALDRGELCVPGDNIAQWTIYCFVLFIQFSEDLCRKFVIAHFTDIAEKYCFDVTPSQCRVLANIFMNNYSILKSPDSTKEARLKELKLE